MGSDSSKFPSPDPPYEGEVLGFEAHYEYKGFTFGPPFDKETVMRCEEFEFDSRDIILAAFPKTGNTWVQEILWFLTHHDDLEGAKEGQASADIMARFPMMEVPTNPQGVPSGIDTLEKREPPRLINTHLPWNILGPALEEANPKIVIMLRNPKDQAVSYFHFINSIPFSKVEKFNDFFRLYINGKCLYGNYIEHTAMWWEERERPNILFLTYEELKNDCAEGVRRLAKFLEKDVSEETIQQIVELTKIDVMRKTSSKAGGDQTFFRKGVVGDWENYFSKEQSDLIESECKRLLEPKGLKFDYGLK